MSNKKKILFSIIIPTYNNDFLLKKAIYSVISQTLQDFELLIIDNNSKDQTSEIISSFNDSRIKHIKINNEGIIAKSRNLGINLAKGEWIAFLDSDDIWYYQRLEKISNTIKKVIKLDVISTNEYKVYDNSSKKLKLFYGVSGRNKYKQLILYGNRFSPSATVVRKSFLKKNSIFFKEDKKFVTVEDYDFWLMLAFYNAKFIFLKSFEGEYLIHLNNASNKINLHNQNLNNLLKNHIYNIQQFTSNKDQLYRKIMNFRKFSVLLKTKNIKNLFLIFIESPFFIFNILLIKFIIKLKNEIIYFFKIN
tara:strand:+ start:90 stop:1007 length:918 start_codon:yes stop_codon:yes gene_type:complete